jgi:hypothetical protein
MHKALAGATLVASVLALVAFLGRAAASPQRADLPPAPKANAAQTAKAGPRPAPRTAAGKVDLSGIWSADPNFISDLNDALQPGESLPLQAWAAALTRERLSKDDPPAHCLPTGVPRQTPHPWRIAQGSTHVFILFEGNTHSFRQIFLNLRSHPDDPDPTWYGHSIASWEGDTLVVDSVGFNDRFWFDFAGHPHTERLHIVERFRRPNFDSLEYEVTLDDPGAYTRPFTLYGRSHYEHDTELMEYVCNENNQDVEHIVGKDSRNRYSRETPAQSPRIPAGRK